MNWQEALAEIESVEFDANVNVVSGLRAFFRAVDKEPSVNEARRFMTESGECREEVIGRICDLAMSDIDTRYENPHDTPLAVLLWLTYYAAPEFANLAAHYTEKAPNCWYASKIANSIVVPPPTENSNVRMVVSRDTGAIGTSSSPATTVRLMDYSRKYRFLNKAVPILASSKIHQHTFGVGS